MTDQGAAEGAGSCPTPLPAGDAILLGHGSGGRLTSELVSGVFVDRFANPELARLGDSAVVEVDGTRLAITTDAFVVKPAFFPGSDIGALSVNGTINDLAMVGATPLFLAAAFILEEGLLVKDLSGIADSMAEAARLGGVTLVTGDTKVVERGSADGIFITTSGVGRVPDDLDLGPDKLRAGDAILVSGPIGTHGVAVMSRRAGIGFDVDIVSDTAPLSSLVEDLLGAAEVHCLRDATRGGLATVLCELASASGVRVAVREADVPVAEPVRAACATLGLDPLYVANEGVCVAAVAGADTDAALRAANNHPLGEHAAIVGFVDDGPEGVQLETLLGTSRPLHMLAGEALPRIC